MIEDLTILLHKFFFFLSTPEGILYRSSIEIIVFGIVTYMTISEYLREKNAEHKYLFLAFAGIALHRFITIFIYFNAVFSVLELESLKYFMPVALHTLEAFAFILLANAFIYPYRRNRKKIVSSIELEAVSLFAIALLIELLWIRRLDISSIAFTSFYGFLLFNLLKIAILCYPVYKIIEYKEAVRHRKNIIFAFLIYAFVPFLYILSFLIYRELNPRFEVFSNPFPFISVMLFTKIVYLKLADKATLKDQLKESQQKYREAKEISEMKDSFVSVVSHELRTPLTTIKLYVNLLKSGKFGAIKEKQGKPLNIVNQETDRLSNLIEDILHLSKLESKKESLNIKEFNFYNYAIENPLYELAREKGIKIKVNVPKGFTIKADGEKFKLVFINLIGNAIKFTDKKGIIAISAANDKDKAVISINDTGKGIAKEHISKLFDKFFQVESYMTRDKGGTGLGLAIAKRIVDLHHGEIKVESELGKGSTFSVILPKLL